MRLSSLGFVLGSIGVLAPACGGKVVEGPGIPETPPATKIRLSTIRGVDKVDLLLVVDNSLSMADKQFELSRRIPQLVKALTNPDVDPSKGKPKYHPAADLHIGVISSSLGSHGTSACDPSVTNKRNDDRGHLLPREGEVPSFGSGWVVDVDGADPKPATCPGGMVASTPLSWVFDPARDPAAMFKGTAGTSSLQVGASCVVASVKDDGCGYEETLESAYHFLVDPAPYASAQVKCTFSVPGDACGNNKIDVTGIDSELLAQRKAFLRPDSVLAVVILTDEDDYSLKARGLNWRPWGLGSGHMERGWTGCASVPDDFEPDSDADYLTLHTKYRCYSCFEDPGDPHCKIPWAKEKLNTDIDGRNLRGFHQVQRYGFNFLWGRQRYVDAFTKPTAIGSDGVEAANPVFASGLRDLDMIIVAGIVGVPVPLVTNADGTPKSLTDADWVKIAGPVEQRDPHMIESIAPRTAYGMKKFAGDRSIDPINGGDRDIPDGDDLQYACIGKRTSDLRANDCVGPAPETKNPLCDPGGKQPYFHAYPGLRHLRVLRDLGPTGFVASICANDYSAAVRGIIDRIQIVVDGQCLHTALPKDSSGALRCVMHESFAGPDVLGKTRCEDIGAGYCTPGSEPCRRAGSEFPPITPDEAASKLKVTITAVSTAGVATQETVQTFAEAGNVFARASDGKKHLICEVMQLAQDRVSPSETTRCTNDESYTPSVGGGWCYTTNPALVSDLCIRRGVSGKLRFVGAAAPKSGSELFALCAGG